MWKTLSLWREKPRDKLQIYSLLSNQLQYCPSLCLTCDSPNTIINHLVCLIAKENIIVFFALTHTNYFSQKQQHFALSSLFSSPRTALSLSLSVVFFFWHVALLCYLSLDKALTLILLMRHKFSLICKLHKKQCQQNSNLIFSLLALPPK